MEELRQAQKIRKLNQRTGWLDGLGKFSWQDRVGRAVAMEYTHKAERTLSLHDMNRQECRTKRIDSVCGVAWIPLCARDGSVIKWGRGEGETLSIHVVWTRCALGLRRRYLSIVDTGRCEATSEGGCQPFFCTYCLFQPYVVDI